MQLIEILTRNERGVLKTTRIIARVASNPRQSDVEYFCVYKTSMPDFHSITMVDRWGGTGGYFHKLMLNPQTTEKLRNQIKSKQVILL